MSLFNFFKPKKTKSEDLELIFQKAANDNALRPLFYRTLLNSDLLVLTFENEHSTSEKIKDPENTNLLVRTLEDGRVPIFTSTDRIFDKNTITEKISYVKLNAKLIFEMFKEGTAFILNPYSDVSKELLSEEINKLLRNEFYIPSDILKVKSGEIVLLGIPEIYPVNLVESLKRYFDTREEIKAAYLSLVKMESTYHKPYLLLGLEITKGDLKNIFGEACEIAKPYLDKGEPIDMISIGEKSKISGQLKKSEYKIY